MKSPRGFARASFVLLVYGALLGTAACGTTGEPPPPISGEDYNIVRVLYATDRARTGSELPAEMFGSDRAELSYGYCEVSIPHDHRMGELESPRSFLDLLFPEDPTKHVMLLTTQVIYEDGFFADLAAQVRASAKSSTFLFVHGFNVTFEDAARRTAQIAYDLRFDGAAVFYSWPSKGSMLAYAKYEATIAWAETNLRAFLEDFFDRSDAENIYIIAHSMGNRALTSALASLLYDRPDVRGRLTEVILSAPDIDADLFKREIAPVLAAAGRPVTLYASSEDRALATARQIDGNVRAGESGRELVVLPGIETIDATGMDTGFVRHSYFAEARSVLADIYFLIHEGRRPDDRFGLRAIDSAVGRYWIFR